MPLNPWWTDSGASIRITNSLQGFKNKRKANKDEVNCALGMEMKSRSNEMRPSLQLESKFVLNLINVAFVCQ